MKRDLKIRLGLFAVAVVAALYGFWGMFGRAMHIFNDPIEDMSFGWYVPVFSAYLLWRDRDELKRAAQEGAPSLAAALLSVPLLALALVGSRGLQMRFEQMAFAGLAVTLPWAFFGRRMAKACLFPAAYLLFTVPISSYLDFFTVHLRLLASGVALAALNGLGFDAAQQGTAIVAGGAHPFSIDVAEPCSGLRSLMALTALTAAYARLTQPTWTRRAALFACAMPLAVAGNVMRIVTICAVAAIGSKDFALGFYHDYSGFIVFIVAISLMVAAGEAITRLCGKPKEKSAEVAAASARETGKSAIAALACFLAFLLAAFAFVGQTPTPRVAEPPAASLPAKLCGMDGEELRYCQNDQCLATFRLDELNGAAKCTKCGGELDVISSGEKTILPGDTRFMKRSYADSLGRSYVVSLVFGGTSKSSLHRPEMCLPAQGFQMGGMRDREFGGRPFHLIDLAKGTSKSMMAYTFFNQTGYRTSSHLRRILTDVWDRSVHNRVDRWVMMTVSISGASEADAAAFLAELAKVVEPDGKDSAQ